MKPAEAQEKRLAREAALQMLYQCDVGRSDAADSIASYWTSSDSASAVSERMREFANAVVHGTVERRAQIDALLSAHAQNWRVERMTVIDRIVLRMAVYEMLAEPATPSKVIINEAIELARSFSGEESVPFINGVLDGVKKELRRI